jgi:hypothetical protein
MKIIHVTMGTHPNDFISFNRSKTNHDFRILNINLKTKKDGGELKYPKNLNDTIGTNFTLLKKIDISGHCKDTSNVIGCRVYQKVA